MESALAAFPLRVRGLLLVVRLVGRLLHLVLIFIAIEEDLVLVVASFLLFIAVTEGYFPSLSLPADTFPLCRTSSCSLHVWLRVTAAASADISTVSVAAVCSSSSTLIAALCLTSPASSMSYAVASLHSMLITALCLTSPASSMSYAVASCSLSMLITALYLT